MKKSILIQINVFLLVFFFSSLSGMAQRRITGVVEDAKTNSPLEGATVTVKGRKENAITEAGGKFELNAPNGKVSLVVSFVGFQTKTVAVGADETSVRVSLTESTNQLNDVVIVGVQTQSKRMATSAVSTVLSKDIENLPAPSVDQLL